MIIICNVNTEACSWMTYIITNNLFHSEHQLKFSFKLSIYISLLRDLNFAVFVKRVLDKMGNGFPGITKWKFQLFRIQGEMIHTDHS